VRLQNLRKKISIRYSLGFNKGIYSVQVLHIGKLRGRRKIFEEKGENEEKEGRQAFQEV